ncbi:DUF998 domain-containing protein [Marinobacter panjinensis]|uniref:DUF998 domain-containing protein n=1 Tax=Marinobacter panjinensis TaxID=2576384 RepID=A0A4U6R9X5_9GAMM|nr:DUF998 domain-containing protein [Marinobacter panjinensis]
MLKSTLGGVLGPVIFSTVMIAAASNRPGYSHIRQFISELGATGSENAALMNYAGFLLGGLLIASFGVALLKALPKKRTTLIASVFVSLFGLGVAASGLISCDIGCPQGSGTTENLLHNAIAPIAFLCLIAATLMLGIYWWQEHKGGVLASYSVGTGIASLLLLALLVSSLEARDMTGLWQRILLGLLFSWCIVVALRTASNGDRELPSNKAMERTRSAQNRTLS